MKLITICPCDIPLPPDFIERGPGVTFRLPYLTAKEAWVVVAILDQFQRAIWRTHGDAMADYHGMEMPDMPAPPCAQYVEKEVDEDTPF